MPPTIILGHFPDFITFLSIFPHRMCQFFYVNSWYLPFKDHRWAS